MEPRNRVWDTGVYSGMIHQITKRGWGLELSESMTVIHHRKTDKIAAFRAIDEAYYWVKRHNKHGVEL